MTALFYISAAIAIVAALMVVTRANAMHALIYLVITVLSIASVFYALGAAFVAVLQILVYAGAIMVLFVFVVMLLNIGEQSEIAERRLLRARMWILPALLAAGLLVVFLAAVTGRLGGTSGTAAFPAEVGYSLFTTYIIGVELASVLLLAGLVAAYHFGMIPGGLEADDE